MLLRGHMLLRDHMLRPHAAAVADIMLSRDQPPSHVHRVASKVGVHLDDDSAGVNDVIAWLLRDRCRWLLLDSKPTVSQCQHTASAIRLAKRTACCAAAMEKRRRLANAEHTRHWALLAPCSRGNVRNPNPERSDAFDRKGVPTRR